jgi:hypothetical protein
MPLADLGVSIQLIRPAIELEMFAVLEARASNHPNHYQHFQLNLIRKHRGLSCAHFSSHQ